MLIFMEAKTTLARRQDAVQGDFMRKMLTNAGCLLCGILVSRGAVLGSLAPFGASFAAAVPRKYLLSSLLGTAFGYVLLKPSDSFRYLAVVAAIGGLRWLLGDLDKVTKSKVFAPLVAFVPIFATGVSLLFVSTSTLTTFADCVTEAVIAGAAAYFISTALHLAGDNRSFEVFSQQETASVVMSGCILILAFGSIAWQNISLGRIIAMLVTLRLGYGWCNQRNFNRSDFQHCVKRERLHLRRFCIRRTYGGAFFTAREIGLCDCLCNLKRCDVPCVRFAVWNTVGCAC